MPSRMTVRVVLALALVAGLGTSAALAGGGGHPYFNDRGAIPWYRTVAEAQRAARAEGKVILIEFGRRRCSQCNVLVSQVIPDARVRPQLARVAVGLAAECDDPEVAVDRLFDRHLPNARMLPFVAFVTSDLEWITGFAGRASVTDLLSHLRQAQAYASCTRAPAPSPAPSPRRKEAPAPKPSPSAAPSAPRAAPPAKAEPPVPPPAGCPPPATPEPPAAAEPDETCPGGTCGRHPLFPAIPDALLPPPTVVGPDGRDATPAPVAPAAPPVAEPAPAPPACSGSRFPATDLAGSPDGDAVDLPAPRVAAAPIAKEPAPKAKTPERSAVVSAASALTRIDAAATRGRWAEVLRLAEEGDPDDARVAPYVRRAHRWAHERLDYAVASVAAGRFDDALAAVLRVREEMRGQPEAVDAGRGALAVETARDLSFLDRDGVVARTARRNAYEELRGTRWARLFAAPPADAPN
jgi:hypothetical protein